MLFSPKTVPALSILPIKHHVLQIYFMQFHHEDGFLVQVGSITITILSLFAVNY